MKFATALFLASGLLAIGSLSGTSMAADASPKTSAAPESSSADNPSWKEYKKLLENYYFLDKQKAGNISCRVSVPQLQDLIDARRQKYRDKLILDENLHDFSVTYDRTKGLSFDSPHQNTHIRPGAQLSDRVRTDPAGAENVLKKTDKDFDETVINIEGDIHAVMDLITSIVPQNNLRLKKNGNVTVVSFDDVVNNNHAKIIYSGTTQKITGSSPTASGTATADYQPLNGKLALAHVVGETTQGSTKRDHTYSISYQDLGSAFFPKQILIDEAPLDGTQQGKQSHIEYDFKDCKTSDLSP